MKKMKQHFTSVLTSLFVFIILRVLMDLQVTQMCAHTILGSLSFMKGRYYSSFSTFYFSLSYFKYEATSETLNFLFLLLFWC